MILFYLLIGAAAGFLSGLLSIGGGIVIIPSLAILFAHLHLVPDDMIMQVVVGTSLATVIFTASSSMYAHHKRGAVVWPKVKKIALGLACGTVIGATIAHYLPSDILSIIFGIFLVVIGTRLFFSAKQQPSSSLSVRSAKIGSLIIGLLSGILGVGGGVLSVPFFLKWNLDMRFATGTSVACGFIVGVIGTISYMVTGLSSGIHLPYCTGYIYWPAFLGIVSASVFFAPYGAALAHKLPQARLKRIFAVFLWLMAINMIFFA